MGGKTDMKNFLRRISKAGCSVIMGIMPILDTILKPARRAWSECQERRPGNEEVAASRDLETGDPDCERQRDIFSGVRESGRRDRGMTHPDEYDIFGNPREEESSLESLLSPRSARVPFLGDDALRGLGAQDEESELLLLNAVDVDHPSDLADPSAEPTCTAPPYSPFGGLVLLRAISTFDLNTTGDEDDAEKGNIGANSIITDQESTSAGPSSSAAAAAEDEQPPLPHWLVARKATAGPRATRFTEVDVDGPADIAPPDLESLDQQGLPFVIAGAGLVRGHTWSPGQGGGKGEEEDDRKPAARRLRPLSV